MKTNNEIQAALIAYLKSQSTLTDEVGSAEIREDQWQGREFAYPNVRLRLISNVPLSSNCDLARVTFSAMVFTEDASSLNSDRIAGIINTILHDHSFSSNNITFHCRTTNLVPALRSNIQEWRSEVLLVSTVSG